MKKLMKNGDKRMTLREVAEITGVAYSTVAAYAKKAGWTQNGKQTLLDEKQVTIILEAMKCGNNNQHNLTSSIEGINTTQSRALRIDLLHKQIEAEMQAEIDELRIENKALKKDNESVHRYFNYAITFLQEQAQEALKERIWLPYKDD